MKAGERKTVFTFLIQVIVHSKINTVIKAHPHVVPIQTFSLCLLQNTKEDILNVVSVFFLTYNESQ